MTWSACVLQLSSLLCMGSTQHGLFGWHAVLHVVGLCWGLVPAGLQSINAGAFGVSRMRMLI